MGKTDKLTERQLMVLVFISLLSPLMRILPTSSVILAGRAAWLSPLPALAAGALLLAAVRGLKKNAAPGDGLADMALKGLGGVAGRVFCILCALWLTFYAGFTARSAAERMLSALYPNGNTVLFIIVLLAVAVITASGTTKGLARTAEVCLPLLALVMVIVILAAATDVKMENLLPVTYKDLGGILLGAVPVFDVMSLFTLFLFLEGHVEKKPGKHPKRFPYLGMLALTAFAIIIVTLGSVSDKMAEKLQNAFFVIIRNVQLFGVIERVEAVVVAVWIVTDFTMLGALLLIVSEIWRAVFGTKKRVLYVFPSGVLAGAAAFLIASNAFSLLKWSEFIIPVANMGLAVILIPLTLAVGKLRKKL
ncbi:MAG: GerAB/ArcD/ProY family transporter [Oscillospiraceae bacterium]